MNLQDAHANVGMVIDMNDDTAFIFGKKIGLYSTTIGHYTLPICLSVDEKRVNEKFIWIGVQNEKAFEKFLTSAGKCEPALFELVVKVTDRCETCIKYRKPRNRPVVSMSIGTEFNQAVAMDLKVWGSEYFLVLVDFSTRFCQAVGITNKRPETVIKGLFLISVFGAPRLFSTDNGG